VVSDSQIPSKRSGLYTDDSVIHQSRFKIHFDVRGSFFLAREFVRRAPAFLWKMFFVFRRSLDILALCSASFAFAIAAPLTAVAVLR
jgi:hypothetical protein